MGFNWIIKFKGYEIPIIGIVIFLLVTVWSLGMIIAPLTIPPDSVKDLSGATVKVDNEAIFQDMNPYAKHYYESGDVNCHTKVERSYFINGNQMPFCARDVGIFFGMSIGLGIVLFIRLDIKLWWLFGGLVPMGVDWLGNSFFEIYHSNETRVATGGLAGIVIMLALGYVVFDISKGLQMKKDEKESSLDINEQNLNPDNEMTYPPGDVGEAPLAPETLGEGQTEEDGLPK